MKVNSGYCGSCYSESSDSQPCRQRHRRITKPSLVKFLPFKQSTFKRPPPFKGSPFKALYSQVSAGILLKCCCAHTKIPNAEKRIFPFSLYCFISSGNFPLQLIPGDYHVALKPWCTSAHRTNETPEQGDGQTAKWYFFSWALWLCLLLAPPFWIVWSVPEEPSEDPESELFLDKERKPGTTQLC